MIADVQNDLIFVFILCLLVTSFAWRKKFYSFPPSGISFFRISSFYPLCAFALYFLGMIILGPIVYLSIKTNPYFKQAIAWTQVFTLISLFGIFALYLSRIKKETLHYIFTGNSQSQSIFEGWPKNMGLGILTWAISYPVVLLVNLFMQKITWRIWQVKGVDQVAVEMLKNTKENPWLFGFLAFVIVFIVPFLEELIFRGFLQTYLRQYLGKWKALLLSALIFSLFHYSAKQGIGNLELIVSLYVLAVYLGFLYERQKNLWASYGLHLTFNAISIISLI